MPLIPKREMSEEEIKLYYITPALVNKGWGDVIRMEKAVRFTDGRINISGNVIVREAPKKADYVLYINRNNPIAVVEAKENKYTPSFGLQQAIEYAQRLDVPFAYSSNGDSFVEHDFFTGAERDIPLEEFPTYEELVERYEREKGITDEEKEMMNLPYCTGQNIYSPRFYQRVAINRTLEAIAKGEKRILLTMATGTGKTYTAFQICYRLLQNRSVRKILYLADRNFLVDQTIRQDFAPLSNVTHKIDFQNERPEAIGSYSVYFSLYQMLSDREDDEQDEETSSRLATLFSPTFFDLVIVDECHRGSAKKDSTWRKILDYFSGAIQIGMTATPKEDRYASNITYFGEPVYSYSLKDGIEDGFLAPFKVINIKTDISDEWRPTFGQTDIHGQIIEDRIYNNSDYDYNIVIEDRIYQVASEITDYLKSTDRMQKTIVFCATEESAELMRKALVNLNQDKVRENPDYVVRITGSDVYGKSKLDYFLSVSSEYPVIATTSKLLSTGADCKMVKLIVLDEMIGSMTEFKQIIGRGTRIREEDGKLYFIIMDFRNVTRLFADPDWDGPIERFEGGEIRHTDVVRVPSLVTSTPNDKPYVSSEGCPVRVINRTVSVYDGEGRLLRYEDIVDYTRTNLLGNYSSLKDFIDGWSAAEKKEEIRDLLRERGIDLEAVKADQGMSDVDDFDFICHVAYDAKPLTRKERAEGVKQTDFFSRYSGPAREVLEVLLDKYADSGVYDIESPELLRVDPLRRMGSPSKIAGYFGGRDGYFAAIKALETQIYQVGVQ